MLDDIVAAAEIRASAAARDIDRFRRLAADAAPTRGFATSLATPDLSVIAEIKRRSPSVGTIDAALDPAAMAGAYERGGAAAISVLTEPDFFSGSIGDLGDVRAAVGLPVLRKDFLRNEAQVWESRAAGADAVLLIVATLDADRLTELVSAAADAHVDALVEAHTADEVRRAIDAGAAVIGLNNRDLATFETDLATAESCASLIPSDVVSIAESGIWSVDDARRMADAGFDAVLVGEALVRHGDPGRFVSELASVR